MAKKEILKEILEKIKERDGKITPKAVVDEARAEDSPIHNNFEWDNSVAAELYRQNQAMHLIVSVKMESGVPEYYNVSAVVEQAYYPVAQILSSEEMYKQVLKQAITELIHFNNKYKTLKELKKLINTEELEKLNTQLSI